jgi:hypothetical protein
MIGFPIPVPLALGLAERISRGVTPQLLPFQPDAVCLGYPGADPTDYSDGGNVTDPQQVLLLPAGQVGFVFGTWEVPAYVKNALINTDDNALLEFSAPRTLYIDTSEANFQELSRYSRGAAPYLRH